MIPSAGLRNGTKRTGKKNRKKEQENEQENEQEKVTIRKDAKKLYFSQGLHDHRDVPVLHADGLRRGR